MYMCFDTTLPDPANNNIYTNCAGESNVYAAGQLHANKIIVESGGNANVLMVNIPDAVLVSEREGAKAAYAENCPNCSFQELAVTLDQLLTGGVPEPSFQLSKLTTASTGFTSPQLVWHTASSTHSTMPAYRTS